MIKSTIYSSKVNKILDKKNILPQYIAGRKNKINNSCKCSFKTWSEKNMNILVSEKIEFQKIIMTFKLFESCIFNFQVTKGESIKDPAFFKHMSYEKNHSSK